MNLIEKVKSVILSNVQPKEKQRIGVEVETLFYNMKGKRIPTSPAKGFCATDLLNELEGLSFEDEIRSTYTSEPGGQLEWGSPPVRTLHELNQHFNIYKNRIKTICKEQNIIQSDLALEPIQSPEDIDLIKADKYQLMHERFKSTGNHGPWMMRNTTSVQVNVDFESENEAEEMAYLADCLQPFCSVLFANSPFMNGNPAGNRNLRYTIWGDTDPARCGSLFDHGITKPSNLLENYIHYILSSPAIFVQDETGKIIPFHGTLGEWLRAKDENGTITDKNIMFALHQIFTHVRFKNVIEIRGADRPPFGFELAPAAFWLGLTYEQNIRNEALQIINSWRLTDKQRFQIQAESLDSFTNQNNSFKKTLEKVLDLSLRGLDERSKLLNIQSERIYLESYLDKIATDGIPSFSRQREEIKRKLIPISM